MHDRYFDDGGLDDAINAELAQRKTAGQRPHPIAINPMPSADNAARRRPALPKPLTREEIERIKALADAATPGPWGSEYGKRTVWAPIDVGVAEASPTDAAFIAATREAVPHLIADLERERELLKEHQAQSALAGCGRNRHEIATYLREAGELE